MNSKSLPSRFSIKPLAFLIPLASLSLASSYVDGQVLDIQDPRGSVGDADLQASTTPITSVNVDPGGSIVAIDNTWGLTIDSISQQIASVTIAAGGLIQGGTSASTTSGYAGILVKSSNVGTINNSGTISGGFNSTNNGLETGNGGGIALRNSSTVGSIINSGLIKGDTVSNGAPSITITDSTLGSLTNSGTINAGIEVGRENNNLTGQITDGIFNNKGAVISNSEKFRAVGIFSASEVASLSNSGEIEGRVVISEGAKVNTIINDSDGVIKLSLNSSPSSTAAAIAIQGMSTEIGSLTNNGEIDGRVEISDGASIVDGFVNSGIINGSLTNNAVIAGGVSVIDDGSIEDGIVNNGTISGGIFSGSCSGCSYTRAGIEVTNATLGSLTNSGIINDGVFVNDAMVDAIVNDGTISGGSSSGPGAGITVVNATLGSLTNSGSINDGVFVVNFSDSIQGDSVQGDSVQGDSVQGDSIQGDIINNLGGEISGGIRVEGSILGGDIVNAGEISRDNSSNNSGLVPAPIGGAIYIDGRPPSFGQTNQDTGPSISAIVLPGKIDNSGIISNTADALPIPQGSIGLGKPDETLTDPTAIYLNYVTMDDGIYNSGKISSQNGTGIRVANGSVNTITNAKEGTISGGNGYAIFVDDTAAVTEITNNGVISGIVDFGGSGGLYNSAGGESGQVLNATALQIGAQTTGPAGALVSTINGDFNFSGAMTFAANGFDGGVRYGQLNTTGNAVVAGALNINVSGETFFQNAEVLELIKADGSLTADITSEDDNSLLLDFVISEENNTLLATVEREEVASVVEELFVLAAAGAAIADQKTAKEFSAEINDEFGGDISAAGAENTLALAATLDRIALLVDSGDIPASSELGQTLALMQALEDPVALIQAIKSLEPESGGAGSEGSKAAAGAVSAVISSRQASLRSNLYETGMVAGDDVSITGFWIQGYDKDTEQELREGIDGFDVDMYGVALGADAPVGERATVGLAISYAESQVDSTGIESNKMTIDSYQISSYVSFNEDDYYLDALVSYARNEYDGKRNLFGGLTANSDYAGDQYGIRARGGYPFVLASGLHVTPNTSIEYSYLKEESYQEDGAGNSGLDIGSQSLDALVLAAGVKVAYPFTTESDTTWMPDFHIEVRRDFIGDKVELDTNFIGVGGAGFSINGASVEQTAYKAGIGLRAWSQSSLSFMFRYDYTYKKDYNSQSLAATMRYSF